MNMEASANPSGDPRPRLGTVPEVARFLSMSRSKVYQLMDRGRLPYVKLDRCRRIAWSDVEALLAQNRVGPA